MQVDFYFYWLSTIFVSLGAGLLFLLASLLMYPLTPKEVMNKYFRPPYFSEAFVEFYSGFPIVLYRGIMFMRLAAYPSSGKKRNLTEVYKELPVWYRNVSKVLLIGLFFSAAIFFSSTLLALVIL